MTRKVFLSLMGTLRLMQDGEVSDDDLAHGLFYLGCTRTYVLETNPEKLQEIQGLFATDLEKGLEVHTKLQQALLTAEAEGRAVWRPSHKGNTQEQLNGLLVANGAQPLNSNLPPVYEHDFIAIAIDRVNNKDGRLLLEPVY
jgi:hypothetical protein